MTFLKMRVLNDNRVVDTGKTKRQLEVIVAGLPRCATSSIQAALESEWLDYGPCMHMAHIYSWPERSQMVVDAFKEEDKEKRQAILREFFNGYAAACDYPGVIVIEDLMDMYPDAKIILNQRQSADVWAKSISESIMFFNTWTCRIATLLFRVDRQHAQMHLSSFEVLKRKYGLSFSRNRGFFVEWYARHNRAVRDGAKKRGRPVLEWQPQDGWRPLCEFLEKPAPPPTVPFPRMNERKFIRKLKIIVMARGLLAWAVLISAVYMVLTYDSVWLGYLRRHLV